MKQTFEVLNVKCGGCASTLMTKLEKDFGKVEVDLEVNPRTITLEIQETQIPLLKQSLKSLGYPFASENMNFVDSTSTKAKSFVSCAVGKFNINK